MTKYRSKKTVEAVRWWKAGDHKNVSQLHMHGLTDQNACPYCSAPLSGHGEIMCAGDLCGVCPGDWIVTDVYSNSVWSDADFQDSYSEVPDE